MSLRLQLAYQEKEEEGENTMADMFKQCTEGAATGPTATRRLLCEAHDLLMICLPVHNSYPDTQLCAWLSLFKGER